MYGIYSGRYGVHKRVWEIYREEFLSNSSDIARDFGGGSDRRRIRFFENFKSKASSSESGCFTLVPLGITIETRLELPSFSGTFNAPCERSSRDEESFTNGKAPTKRPGVFMETVLVLTPPTPEYESRIGIRLSGVGGHFTIATCPILFPLFGSGRNRSIPRAIFVRSTLVESLWSLAAFARKPSFTALAFKRE